MTESEAPSFPTGTDWKSDVYPMGGAKTGAAWQAAWDALSRLPRGEWIGSAELIRFAAWDAECTEGTVRVILVRAANAGVLERKYEQGGERRRSRVFYRKATPEYRWLIKVLADGKYRAVALEGSAGHEYLEELVQRGVLERRWEGRSHYRLTWKPPAGVGA